MTIPRVFAPIKKGDFTITPITVHKQYVIQRSDLFNGTTPKTGSGYKILNAIYPFEPLKLGTGRVYPTNSFDGSYQHIVWKQLDAMYYRYPTFSEGSNERYTYKFLNYSASIIQIPQHDFGEGIKPGSVEFTSSFGRLKDDENGNLYDSRINTESFTNRLGLSLYMGFDDSFKLVRNQFATSSDSVLVSDIYTGNLNYDSYVFAADNVAIADNIRFSYGFPIDSTPSLGKSVYFNGTSSILIPHRNEFDFGEDYTIAFWIRPLPGVGATVFSKRATTTKHIIGFDGISKLETVDDFVNVYPFDIFFDDDVLRFWQNDGIETTNVASIDMVADGSWYHVCFAISGTICNSYLNGNGWSSTQVKKIRNRHDIVVGAMSMEYAVTTSGRTSLSTQFRGFLDEIRFYNRALDVLEIETLGNPDLNDQSAYQTAIIGNVFYKTGKFILSTRDARYVDMLTSDFTLKFRNTHTIYQYETLCRIKKGDFNLSQNPTARQSPYSDLLINEMTSSVEDGGMPTYFNSVGLYNDAGELLVVGKMGQNMRNRSDVDLNLIVRFDT